ncbi:MULTISPECIES: amidohydrolase family protein [unclassified Imperialibacter]|uniref:amidohydrolase family protein n=1 Tax=unclassified Imperialibacter TaxID=2629706 RepID=UPI0012517558|nr:MULTISPECIES: amidohydrolase family protein [unclassified Imperialibacter]CAD5274621.1 Amidohydrolase [Imperialibacter sp. 75]CAD5288294.1 Amidohydrolase [Imperialibacter sp. 89]VVT35605.1 Amidohydrolase family protein [Imperialibacter sp. EC-SDR9]
MRRLKKQTIFISALALFQIFSIGVSAQRRSITPSPARAEGDGPYTQLIIRGAIMVNGTGAPPIGPVDIVIEQNKIKSIQTVGYPGVEINAERRPKLKEGGKEIDAAGMYVLPGFIDMHGHIGGVTQGTPAEYVFKLWMAHGITTIREPSAGNGLDWTLEHKRKSLKNEITAPRILAYTAFGMGKEGGINSPEEARLWVQENAKKGADGIKFFGASPDIMEAALRENKRLGLRAACHHAQMDVARANVLNTASWGLTSMEHWYGLPEAMFDNRTIQDFRLDYNYQNEQHRFGEAGKLWKQAAAPHSEKWNAVMDSLIELDFTLDPTFNIYEANRDLMRARTAEWHQDYTLPSLWDFYQPSKQSHGSYWHYWGTEEEIQWKENYRLWMTFVNEYKNRGGRVTTGSDSGFIFQLYGFAYIREMELLREAGFHPLEVIRSATLYGAQALGMEKEIGSIEVGKLADLVIVEENPLQNLQVLYGTGAIKLTEDNEVVRVGGVKYTIKDGIVYDARQLLEDVKTMVTESKEATGKTIKQPGVN